MNKGKCVLKYVLSILLVLAIINIASRPFTRKNVLTVTIRDIGFEDIDFDNLQQYHLSVKDSNYIKKNSDKFVLMVYSFDVRKKSNNIIIKNMYLEPQFSNFWSDPSDGAVSDEDNAMYKQCNLKSQSQIVLVKRNGLSKYELLKQAKKNKFKLTYDTYSGIDLIVTYFPESQIVKCSK